MGDLFDKLIGRGRKSGQCKNNIEEFIYEIRIICDEIDKTEMWFEGENDPDLIDACLYQKELLNARYRYLLKKVKRLYLEKSQHEIRSDKN